MGSTRHQHRACLLLLACLLSSSTARSSLSHSRRPLQEEPLLPPETAVQEMANIRKWCSEVPHDPGQDLGPALEKAALRVPNAFPSSSKGIVIVNAGSKYAFDELLPRWLDSMLTTLDGDISKHTLLLALGYEAQELCRSEQSTHFHQCVLLPHWLGPHRMYHFGDEWYTVVTLAKLELLLNVLKLGYTPIWMDTDMVHIRNPLPHLAALDAEVAVTGEHCFSTLTDPALLFELNTGIMKLAPNEGTLAWMAAWTDVQRVKMLELFEAGWRTMQPLHRPHDQVTFHKFMLPQLKSNASTGQQALLKLALLEQREFPNFCGGYCGCDGNHRRGSQKLTAHTNRHGHFMTGKIQCPLNIWQGWYSYHVPCVHSFNEKLALIDAYQAAQNLLVWPNRVPHLAALNYSSAH